MLGRLLTAGARAYLALDEGRIRARVVAASATSAFFARALTDDEQRAITIGVYDRGGRGAPDARPPQAWETRWWSRRLPAPPARVLVGAAGFGAEVAHLVGLGYEVDAFEPAPSGAAACARLTKGRVVTATYEELAAAVLDGSRSGPAESLARGRYDASIAGWGSLSLVLAARDRGRTVAALDRVTPGGPVLASFLATSASGRGRDLGARIGRGLAAPIAVLRGRSGEPVDEAREMGSWFGFAHACSREEIEAIAEGVGRLVLWEEDQSYPHVTLVPRT